MRRVLVIGMGSLVMKDDGIGSRVVDAIGPSLREHGVAFLVGETDAQCCFEEIKPGDLVILVDAMVQGKSPGSIDIMLLSEALKKRGKVRTQHEFSLFDLIELHAPETEGYFIGIEVAELDFGFQLSQPLNARFEQICSHVLDTVLNRRREMEHA